MKDYGYGQPTCFTFDRTLSFFGTILLFGTSSLSLFIENTINNNKIGFCSKKKITHQKKCVKQACCLTILPSSLVYLFASEVARTKVIVACRL